MTRRETQRSDGHRPTKYRTTAFPFRMLGFGLVYAWSYCIWDVPSLDAVSHASSLQGSDVWLVSAVITPLACIAAALFGRRGELSDEKLAYALGPMLTALGTVTAAALPYLTGFGHSIALIVAALATGIGPVILIVLWACLFARIDSGFVETIVPASFVATFVCAFLIPNIHGIAATVTVAALPLLSGALLIASKRSIDAGEIATSDLSGQNALRAGNRINIARTFIIILAVYGLGCLLPHITTADLPIEVEVRATMAGMVFAVALSIAIVLFSRHVDLHALFKWITAPFVFAAICAAFESTALAALSNVLMNIVFTGIEIIMILFFVRLAQKTDRTVTFYIGIGECAAYSGVLVGYALGPAVMSAVQAGTVDTKSVCLLVIGAFVLSTLIVPSRDESWNAPLAASDASSDTGRQPVEANAKTLSEAAEGADPLESRSLMIAAQFGLSRRETEIFLLLARGRSRPYIRDSLVLSKNTVATHVRHIYEKAGIHSQQELINLVEAGGSSFDKRQ